MAKKRNRPQQDQIHSSRRTCEPLRARQQTEEALRQSKEKAGDLIRYAPTGIFEIDFHGPRFKSVNDVLCQYLGYTREELLAMDLFGLLDETGRTVFRERIRKRLAGEDVDESVEYRVRAKDGRQYDIILKSTLTYKDGRPEGALVIAHDVTQRKQMEAELRRMNDLLEAEVNAKTEQLQGSVGRLQEEVARRVLAEGGLRKQSRMLEGFFRYTVTPLAFLDRRLRYVRVNDAYARANGKAPEYFAGKDYFALHSDPQTQGIFEQVMRARRPHLAHALPHVVPDDPEQRVTYWDWQLTPLLSDTGDVQFLVLNLEDVTKEQTALRELEHRAGQLQKLTLELSQAEDRERKRLADILHDDLQQVLAAAKFHVGLLDSRAADAAAVHEIAGEVKQMLKEAIDKSRSLSHELSPVFYQVDLADVFEWLAGQMQSRHGLTVRVEVRGRADSPSQAMKAFLYKAAHEMLFNIVKHAGVGKATLRLRRMRKRLWLTISDQGHGFDPKTLAKTSGFGLLTIRERVELLGGRMRIKSAKGRGSIFLIAVPDPAAALYVAMEPAADAVAPESRQQTRPAAIRGKQQPEYDI